MTGAPYHLKPEDFWDRQFGDFPRGRLMTARPAPADGRQPGHWEVHRTTLPVSGRGDFTPCNQPVTRRRRCLLARLGLLSELTADQQLAEHRARADPSPEPRLRIDCGYEACS